MPDNALTVTSTAYLVVHKDVICSTAFRVGIGVIVERDTKPVPEQTPAVSVLEVETPEREKELRSANLLRMESQTRVLMHRIE